MHVHRLIIATLCLLPLLHACGGEPTGSGTGAAGAAAGSTAAAQTPATAPRPGGSPAAATGAGGFPGSGTLSYPDDLQMVLLGYRSTGRQAPLRTWAQDTQPVRMADEFTRAAALQVELDRLESIFASTADIGTLQIRLRSNLSEYDAAAGGFYLDALAPGSTVTFRDRLLHEQVTVRIDNAAAAFFWPLDAEAARGILADTGRRVTLDAELRLTGAEPRSSGPLLASCITGYRIHSSRNEDGDPLAVVAIE